MGWELLDEIFTHHLKSVTDYRQPLHVTVGSPCMKAYNAREATLHEMKNRVFPKVIPHYIRLLQEQRKHTEAAAITPEHQSNEATTGVAQDRNARSYTSPHLTYQTRRQGTIDSKNCA